MGYGNETLGWTGLINTNKYIKTFMTKVPIIQKLVHSFAEQIKDSLLCDSELHHERVKLTCFLWWILAIFLSLQFYSELFSTCSCSYVKLGDWLEKLQRVISIVITYLHSVVSIVITYLHSVVSIVITYLHSVINPYDNFLEAQLSEEFHEQLSFDSSVFKILFLALIIFLIKGNKFQKTSVQVLTYRKSHWRCFTKKYVLKNLAIFTARHLCWSLFLIKLQAFKPATLSKRDSNIGYFMGILPIF